ncbi:MAG TPA: ABC transporter ATP-binding protein [Desulfurococcaceae archaeon]|nr:ABC transporter ATP-binding protein [Desulfurococcaceae archaeon]
MVRVKLSSVTKRFGTVVAVDHVDLEVEHGELFTLLGPSGCGKTTTLRIIAGLEYPDEGEVYFDEENVTFLPPYRRNVGMVFQNWALWPHMTVFENIAYGLKLRKIPKDEIVKRVKEVLKLVRLEGLEDRYPTQLSGGQQQRVALARALVVQPRVLLLDEPLSNLDAKLRIRMREEIKRIQRDLRITAIYVTHDQEEAMSISDRIAIMNRGRILQIGKPEEIYRYPANLFVATFIGRSSAMTGIVKNIKNGYAEVAIGTQQLLAKIATRHRVSINDKVVIVTKPEDVELYEKASIERNCLTGYIKAIHFLGHVKQVIVNIDNNRVSVYIDPETIVTEGQEATICIDPDKAYLFHSYELTEYGFEEIL